MPLNNKSLEISPEFRKRVQVLREQYFSRNGDLWPIFKDPGFADIIGRRKQTLRLDERLAAYPQGAALKEELLTGKLLREQGIPAGSPDPTLLFAATMSKCWEDPRSVENVICLPCDPGIYGAAMGALVNANLVYAEYCETAEDLEKAVVRQIADMVGYDPAKAGGIFTQGGTFCNMYGYLFGLRKALPESVKNGLEGESDYRFISSQGGHYSNTTTLSIMGVNIDKKSLRVRLTDDNKMDLVDFEMQLRACFQLGCKVPTIMLTMGTTDTFGVDRVKPVWDIVEKLMDEYDMKTRPHIHVDSAVGWPMIFFLDYDFDNNPLDINEDTLSGLRVCVEAFQELKYADSFTVDFHKWGFVPYTSSLVMVKDDSSFKALEHDPENFSYFEKDTQGYTHLQSTMECSRGAAGVFGAYATLRYLGKSGFRTLIAHGLQNAAYFRHRLQSEKLAALVCEDNHGPSVGFRLYDPAVVSDPKAEFAYEKTFDNSEECARRIARNTDYHRRCFLQRGKNHLYTNWIEFASHTDYDERGRFRKLPGEKAVFMNALTDPEHIDRFLKVLHGL